MVHVIVAVEVADQGPEDKGSCGSKKNEAVEKRRGYFAQLVVVGTCLCLLTTWKDCKHDCVKLVSRGYTHEMADIRPTLQCTTELSASARDITADRYNWSHHQHCSIHDCCQGNRQIVRYLLLYLRCRFLMNWERLTWNKWIAVWDDDHRIWNSTMHDLFYIIIINLILSIFYTS